VYAFAILVFLCRGGYIQVISLPLCRKATGESWYAFNRLGLNQLMSQAWGVGVPNGSMLHCTITRVMEKPTLLSIEVVKHVISDIWGPSLAAGEIDQLNFVSDNGRHFSSYRWLDFTIYDLPNKYRIACSTTFGQACHMKGPCDGAGGLLERFRNEHVLDADITTELELKACYDKASARSRKLAPTGPGLMTAIFMPGEKARCDNSIARIDKATLPCKLREAHQWLAVVNDVRLKIPTRSLVGKFWKLTGLNISAWQVPHEMSTRKCAAGAGMAAVYLNCEGAAAEEVEAPDAEADEQDLLIAQKTKEHLGWKVSYRKGAAEQLSIPKVFTHAHT
jgi:hypothetical protein